MPHKYKVKQDSDGKALVPDGAIVPNVGTVRNGYIETNVEFENPNFELVGEDKSASHLDGVVPQSEQSAQPTAESDGQ